MSNTAIKTAMVIRQIANPKYKPKPPFLIREITDAHPRARQPQFQGKGKFVDMPDYVLEHLMNVITNDESGHYLSLLKDVLLMVKMSIDPTQYYSTIS